MESRPVNAFILTLLGGLFILMGTLLGVVFAPTYTYAGAYVPTYYYPFLLSSAISGVVVLLAAALMYVRPEMHVAWGVIALVLSVTSSIGAVTGYDAIFGVVGIVLGAVGGAMSIAWRTTSGFGPAPAGVLRLCTGCGRYIPMMYPYCAYCGTPAPTVHAPGMPAAGPPPRS